MTEANPTPIADETADINDTPQHEGHRRSSITKIVDAIKKPFHHEKKKEEVPPRLQEAIDKMEARKRATEHQLDESGGTHADILENPPKDV